MALSPPLIQVKNLDLYFGSFRALQNVSVDFGAGELVGLVGDNGAGKTTLIRVLCGIHTPTSGEVYFDGARITTFHPKLAIDLRLGDQFADIVEQGIDVAVRVVSEDGLPSRPASWHLWRDHRVFVPFATIQNWVEAGGKKGARSHGRRVSRVGT